VKPIDIFLKSAILHTEGGIAMEHYIGQTAALATAICWAISSTTFEEAGKRIGSQSLNLIRLIIGFGFLSVFTYFSRGYLLPMDASIDNWKWLALSGFIGFFVGDLLLLEAFVLLGARITMLIFASVPPISAILAFFILGDQMTLQQIIGMLVTLSGIAIVILVKGDRQQSIKLAHPVKGVLFAFGGAVGQATGYIVGKFGLQDYSPFAATQIRILAAMFSFIILFAIKGNWSELIKGFQNKHAMRHITIGSFFGPFIGVSLSLLAVQYTNPGVASTLMAVTPIVLIPVAIFIKKETIQLREVLGAFIAVGGVGLIFLG